jgi:hypothetical protein
MQHSRSRVVSGPTTTPGAPSKPDDDLRASTTTATTARATMTIVGAGGATTSMMTASAAGHRTSGVHGLLAGASTTRSSPRDFGLRPMCQDTMGTPTPVCGSRITSSRATLVERPTISLSSRTCLSTSANLHAHGSSTCRGTRSTTGPICVESSSATSRHVHAPRQAVGAAQLQETAGGESPRVHTTLLQVLHRAPQCDRQRRHLGIPEWHDVHLPHPPTRASHAPHDS